MASESNPRTRAELARARTVLEAYGSDEQRWPEQERELVRRALASSRELRELAQDEATLDAMLDSAPEPRPDAALLGRILAAVPTEPRSWAERLDRWASELWPGRRSWTAAVALGASAILGVGTGLFTEGPNASQGQSASTAELDAETLGDFAFDDFSDLGETL